MNKEATSEPAAIKTFFSNLFNTNNHPPDPVKVDILNAVRAEQIAINSRESNLILFGIKSSTVLENHTSLKQDLTKVNEVFTKIGVNHNKIKSIYRFAQSQSTNQPGLIKVKLNNKDDRTEILRVAKNEMSFKNDLTDKQILNNLKQAKNFKMKKSSMGY